MVEAPGTAPGSATLIPYAVYRHSHRSDTAHIGEAAADFEDFRPPPGHGAALSFATGARKRGRQRRGPVTAAGLLAARRLRPILAATSASAPQPLSDAFRGAPPLPATPAEDPDRPSGRIILASDNGSKHRGGAFRSCS